jgi:trk system potassium uptake protein TrkA
MKIIIVGCGRVGSRLASRLAGQGHDVAIVDEAREAFVRLGGNFTGRTYQGSGMDHDVLRRAGAENADIGVTTTGGDNRNLMIAQLLKHKFGVKRSMARLHDPVRAKIFQDFGIETICTTTVMEGLLEININEGRFPELPGEIAVSGDASILEGI